MIWDFYTNEDALRKHGYVLSGDKWFGPEVGHLEDEGYYPKKHIKDSFRVGLDTLYRAYCPMGYLLKESFVWKEVLKAARYVRGRKRYTIQHILTRL